MQLSASNAIHGSRAALLVQRLHLVGVAVVLDCCVLPQCVRLCAGLRSASLRCRVILGKLIDDIPESVERTADVSAKRLDAAKRGCRVVRHLSCVQRCVGPIR
jgi:hypothetical protein